MSKITRDMGESRSSGLKKTRDRIAQGLGALLLGQKEVDEALLKRLKACLISADLGASVTSHIIEQAIQQTRRQSLNSLPALVEGLRLALVNKLKPAEKSLTVDRLQKPFTILLVGVNGAGKTATAGKLGHSLIQAGFSVLLAAGDTFRAAAVEQLASWGRRINSPVISQQTGSDAAAVIFDAMSAARTRAIDVVLADTSGRLHNKEGLMDELGKIRRIMTKFDSQAPHEVLLVLDGTTGRNGLQQVLKFQQVARVSGLVINKLDGTAKGGFLAEAVSQTGLPVYYLGVGEGLNDLKPFSAEDYAEELLGGLRENK